MRLDYTNIVLTQQKYEMYFKLPSEEDYICVVYHVRCMPIEGGVGGSIAPTAVSTTERSGKNVRPRSGVRNERNTMRTSGEECNDSI